MLKVTFLGTSAGVPSVQRGMPAIAIRYDRETLLWDCGEGTQRQLMRYGVGYGSINAIFISHPHLDHFVGLFGLLETLRLSSPVPKPLSLFAPRGVNTPEYQFIKTVQTKKGKLYPGRGFSVSAFPVKHCRGSYGFIFREDDRLKFHEEKAHGLGLSGRQFSQIQKKGSIVTASGTVRLEDITWKKPGRKIVYSGDCASDEALIEAAEGADLLIHESTFDPSLKTEALERFHSTSEDAALAAKNAGAKRLVLTHISPRYADASSLLESARKIFPETILAEDGLTIEL